MLGSIIEVLESCPHLSGVPISEVVLKETAGAASVRPLPEAPLVRRYTDGSSLRQAVFSLCLRERPAEETGGIMKLMLAVGRWLEKQGVGLPLLDGGRFSRGFEVVQAPAVTDNTFGSRRFEMVCRLLYYQERDEI